MADARPQAARAGGAPARPESLDLRVDSGLEYRIKQCRHGRFLFNRRDAYIGRSLDLYGEYSEEELDVLMMLVRPGDVMVEAGANIGAHTVPLARKLGPKGRIFAFEPQRLVHQILCANLALNGLVNVVTQPVGLGEAAGRAVVPPIDLLAYYNFGGVALSQDGEGEGVDVRTIDSLMLKRCRLIKLDVEGMERAVLLGANATIRQLRPILYVENNPGPTAAPLIAHIASLGYRMWWHVAELWRPNNFFGRADNVYGHVGAANMICAPAGMPATLPGFMKEVTGPDDPPPIVSDKS
jgi:FkbM family methyltransferase